MFLQFLQFDYTDNESQISTVEAVRSGRIWFCWLDLETVVSVLLLKDSFGFAHNSFVYLLIPCPVERSLCGLRFLKMEYMICNWFSSPPSKKQTRV
jgi:hypothetical protein